MSDLFRWARLSAKSVLIHYDLGPDDRDLIREIARMSGYVEVEIGPTGRIFQIRPDPKLEARS